jgi:hypothetical protein
MYYDGNQCTLCTSGTYLSVSQDECSTCPLGTYSSSGFCPKCPPMTYTESRGKSNCDSCPKDSYSQFGFRRCIQCSSTSNICPFGKNGLECSGNGQCSFGGCKCIEGWTSTDCGEVDQDKLSAAQATPNCAVNDHCRGVLSISNPQLDTFKHQGSISIKISRSGGLQVNDNDSPLLFSADITML